MAEHGSDASGQDRRHPPALRRQRTVTDRVDTRVNGVQPAALEPQLDRTRAGSRLEQLPPGDDAVLPTREVGQKAIEVLRGRCAPVSWGIVRWGAMLPIVAVKPALVGGGTSRLRDDWAQSLPERRGRRPARRLLCGPPWPLCASSPPASRTAPG